MKIIFARKQKCIINHFGLAFAGEMVVTNTTKALEKFLINLFPHKDFLNFFNKLIVCILKKRQSLQTPFFF